MNIQKIANNIIYNHIMAVNKLNGNAGNWHGFMLRYVFNDYTYHTSGRAKIVNGDEIIHSHPPNIICLGKNVESYFDDTAVDSDSDEDSEAEEMINVVASRFRRS